MHRLVAEQASDRELDRVEWLGADDVTALGREHLEISVCVPAIDGERPLIRAEDPIVVDVVTVRDRRALSQ